MEKRRYSKLVIDKDKLPDWISSWCQENLKGNWEINSTEKSDFIQFVINNDKDIIKINFTKCNGGLLSINPNVGVKTSISIQIAEYIYERVKNVLKDSPYSYGFSINISEDDFKTIIDLLNEIEGVQQMNYSTSFEKGKAPYYLYKFQGPVKDSVTIKYFLSTNRMQLQGKPLWLFNEIVAMVSENGVEMSDVIDAQLRCYNVELDKKEVYEEMECVLGKSLFEFLSNALKAILSTSFVFAKIDITMLDYSPIVQQALRTFEGFIKKVLNTNGIECLGDTQLGIFFNRPDKDSPFTMQTRYSEILDNKDLEKSLVAMYTFYYNKRHPYFHATAYDVDTRTISNRKVADELFSEIISKMKAWYESVKKYCT